MSRNAIAVINRVYDAQMFYIRQGASPSQITDPKRFDEMDSELFLKFNNEDNLSEYYQAFWTLWRHHHMPRGKRPDQTSFNFMNLNNVYRIRELWRDVPQGSEIIQPQVATIDKD